MGQEGGGHEEKIAVSVVAVVYLAVGIGAAAGSHTECPFGLARYRSMYALAILICRQVVFDGNIVYIVGGLDCNDDVIADIQTYDMDNPDQNALSFGKTLCHG